MIIGFKKIFESMGKPKQLYSDEGNSMRSSKMNTFLNDNDVKSIRTTTHAHTVGRAIRTSKDNLYRRLDALMMSSLSKQPHMLILLRELSEPSKTIYIGDWMR